MDRERTYRRREGGQALILTVLAMAVLLGFAALAIDVGLVFEDRRGQQNAADAAALAGASALPVPLTAIDRARDWAGRNGFVDGQNSTKVKITTPYKDPTIDCGALGERCVEVVISRPRSAL